MKTVDLHCDTLSEIRRRRKNGEEISFGKNNLHIDLEKLQQGNYLLQCFAIYVNLKKEENPLAAALEQADLFREIIAQYSSKIGQVKTWIDLEQNRNEGKISALLTLEEGGCCAGSLPVLRILYFLGVRIMTLTWNYENDLAWPNIVPDTLTGGMNCGAQTEHGLKEKGFAFLEEMERLGILIDVSHLSDAGFFDVLKHTKKPFIASHSNARALCGHVRNLTDEMIRALADRGGVMGLNYFGAFLDPSDQAASSVKKIAEHASYIRKVGGIGCLALGSDFDGISGELEMKNASFLPMLEAELGKQHFTEDEIDLIFRDNALRVLKGSLPG